MRFSAALEGFCKHFQFSRSKATVTGYAHDLRNFGIFMHDPLITQVSDEHVKQYLEMLVTFGVKQNSLLTKSIALRKFFEYWRKKGYPVLDHTLIPIPKREFVMPQVATYEEIFVVLKMLNEDAADIQTIRDRAIILLLICCGIRVGELVALNLEDIDTGHKNAEGQYKGLVRTEKSRGKKPVREIFWYEKENGALKKWLRKRQELSESISFEHPEALFVGIRGWRTGYRLTNSAVSIFMRKLSRQAGLKRNLNPHSFRHLFGHELAKQGANNSTLSNLLGHSSLASSYIYTQMDDKEMGHIHAKYLKNRRG